MTMSREQARSAPRHFAPETTGLADATDLAAPQVSFERQSLSEVGARPIQRKASGPPSLRRQSLGEIGGAIERAPDAQADPAGEQRAAPAIGEVEDEVEVEVDPPVGGVALPSWLQRQMEEAFRADFSSVRIHEGDRASRLGALACAQGNELYFATGQYQPETSEGQALIAHELTHVVQQREGRVRAPAAGKAAVVIADEGLEEEADRAGQAVAHAHPEPRSGRDASRGRLHDRAEEPARKASEAARAAPVLQRNPAHDHAVTRPARVPTRVGPTDAITDLSPAGSLDEGEWQAQLVAAKAASGAERTRAFVLLYDDLVKLAQASGVVGSARINVVQGNKLANGVTPGLNLATVPDSTANGRTGYVNAAGRLGEALSLDPTATPSGVAIVMFPNAFEDKARALATLRHEMEHFQHKELALERVRTWQAEQPGHGVGKAARAEFSSWLGRARDLEPWEQVLVGGAAGLSHIGGKRAVGIHAFSGNTEILAHVEGFMTAFHLIDPAPTDLKHVGFVQLMGVLGDATRPNWASADEPVRAQALGRLQEYYCHTLDRAHRESFSSFVNAQLSIADGDHLVTGELPTRSDAVLPDEALTDPAAHKVGAEPRKALMHGHFFRSLRTMIDRECKGLVPSMKL